ncbi:hypothetical protein C0J52_08458 [Blattella germanica]|nr:hypothetical protein C0J52_08458 [Blattella germanica]
MFRKKYIVQFVSCLVYVINRNGRRSEVIITHITPASSCCRNSWPWRFGNRHHRKCLPHSHCNHYLSRLLRNLRE